MPVWVDQAFHEYAQRMPQIAQLELHEVVAKKRGKNSDTGKILQQEAALIDAALPAGYLPIALDRQGRQLDTQTLAAKLQSWIDNSQNVALLIGGPEGIAPNYLAAINTKWSLSAMTFAHPVVRVMLAEQLYRAWSINAGLPYHRGEP